MYGTIVIGYNATKEARDALALAIVLGEVTGAKLLISYVHQQQAKWSSVDRDYARTLRSELHDVFSEARESVPDGLTVDTTSLPSVYPSRGLHDIAASEKDALLVIGSTHRGPIGRMLIGSVGQLLLEGAPCPVAVAPRGFRDREASGLTKVGAAVDGSPESKAALETASALAEQAGAKLQAIGVAKGSGDELRTRIEDALRPLGADREVEAVVLRGDPSKKLTEAARDLDLLVTGSRGQGQFGRVLLGSVSGKLMRSAASPVLVVPRAGAPHAEAAK
jgi:nucleotide-binding universal stress UspA family protein